MRVRLTGGDRGSINRAPSPDGRPIILNDDLVPGFMLRVGKSASSYLVVTRVKGRPGQIRRSLGTTRNVELAAAREAARRIIEDAQNGIAPGDAEKEAKAAAGGADSFKAVADAYFEDTLRGGGAKLRTKTEMQRKVEKDLAGWLERPIGSITAREISDLIYRKAQTSPIAANRLVSFIKKLMRWAKRRHIIAANPAADIEKPSDEVSRDRYLNDEENHAEGDSSITAIYARYRFDAEAAEALNLWAAKLERLTGGNVVAIRPARATASSASRRCRSSGRT